MNWLRHLIDDHKIDPIPKIAKDTILKFLIHQQN